MARVNKEKKKEVCHWISSRVEELLQAPLEEGAEPPGKDTCILQAIEDAEGEHGYRAPTIRKWYEELVLKGSSLGGKKRKSPKRAGRPPKRRSLDDSAILEEALVVIGELTLDEEARDEASRAILRTLGRRTLELRLKDREIDELRRQLR